jgi:hypothetical protein
MINPNGPAIEYAALTKLIDLGVEVADTKRKDIVIRNVAKAAKIRYFLKALDDKHYLTDSQVNMIYQALIDVAELNQYPVGLAIAERSAPAIAVGLPGVKGDKGDQGDTGPAGPAGSGMNWRGAWEVSTSYAIGDAVQHEGSSYIATAASTGLEPPAGDWSLFAAKGDQGEQGPQGEQGDVGDQGEQGATGATGATGPTGPAGADGSPGLVWQGAWDIATSYEPPDVVYHEGSAYVAVDTSVGEEPPNATYWELLVSKGEDGTDGTDGAAGADGVNGTDGTNSYVYLAYADTSDGNGFSLDTDSNKEYVAFLVSDTFIDDPIASDFDGLWMRFRNLGGDRWTTFSTSSMLIGTGTKTFIVEEDLAYSTGQRVVIAYDADFNQRMEGYVVSYNPNTGQIIISVDDTNGSGTYDSWDVSLQASGVGAGTYAGASPTTTTVGGLVSGSAITGMTYDALFEAILVPFQSPTFSSFSMSGQSTSVEVGTTISGSKTFTWGTTNSGNVTTNSVVIKDFTNTTDLATGLANDGTEAGIAITSVTKTAIGSHVWRIQATDTNPAGSATFNRDFTVSWLWRRYYGPSANATLTEAQIEALTTTGLSSGITGTYSFGTGGYKYLVWDDALGSPTAITGFKDSSTNLAVAMADSTDNAAYSNTANGWSYALVSVTNAEGVTSNKRVYRTKNILACSIDIIVS